MTSRERIRLAVRPQPMEASGEVIIDIAINDHLRIELFDVLGKRLQVLLDGPLSAGKHSLTLNAETLPNGIYYCVAEGGEAKAYTELTVVHPVPPLTEQTAE